VNIYEPDLANLVTKNFNQGHLFFTTDIKNAVQKSDLIFFCLPTPQGGDGQADLKIVLDVSSKIGEYFNSEKIILNKSTVPIGTTKLIKENIAKNSSYNFEVVSNPEFLREGSAVYDFMNPDRVVVGLENKNIVESLRSLYRPFVEKDKLIITDVATSEMIKYASNTFLAAKISFINELSSLASHYGANIKLVAKGMGLDPRIGDKFLNAGIGYGGSCFPKDVAALEHQARILGIQLPITQSIIKVNQNQRQLFFDTIIKYLSTKNLNNSRTKISILGLAFKPNTDDVREAPAEFIIKNLIQCNYNVRVYDPKANLNFARFNNFEINFCDSLKESIKETDAVIILTDWQEFSDDKFLSNLGKEKTVKVLFDGRNIFEPEQLQQYNFDYISIGRKNVIK
jgi:UDPglucose 6-dehydrogenase